MAELQDLIDGLSRPEAWPRLQERVEVVQTHASVVFLGDEEVHKLKKPVDFGFLDYSSLEKRRRCCEAEVRLNRRLAEDVYLGVVPVTEGPAGLRFGGEGEALEWAVRMRRLPEERTFRSLLEDGALEAGTLERFARRLARFFAAAGAGPEVQELARFAVVERNCLENFETARSRAGGLVDETVFARFEELTRRELARRHSAIERRAEEGLARDGHGDLRLDHAYLLEDGELLVVDCIEFNERFRFQDPACDVAFLVMELEFAGCHDLAESFAAAFFGVSDDAEGAALLPLYTAYRHAVRAKVRGLQAEEAEVPEAERASAAAAARAHWLAGLATLAPPDERPVLVLVGGPPASGKSTLARGLAERDGFERISSDETRKRLAGLHPDEEAAASWGEGIYAPEWTERTYAACLRLARESLESGGRVVVDASFREDSHRRAFVELARSLGLRVLWLDCELDARTAAARLRARSADAADASDADAAVQRRIRESWEPPSELTERVRRPVPTAGSPAETLALARTLLEAIGVE